MMEIVRFVLTALFLLGALVVLAAGVLGQYRFRLALNRLHASSMCDSLGLLSLMIGLSISADDGWVVVKFALTMVFLWIASPTAGHLIARLETTTNPRLDRDMEVLEK
ncbi:MAG TPA: monovalent cation/H(+) antiporter subunit G [Candidatus Limiplasma sp.]|nr:monovalent cation/H(+) antiporter subunit G [Candidatus Limiplasma sp.]HRX08288.1 monovalent cation/H(+) antiporter subunit G [Candidatus Limiplasma sp.]